MQCGLAKRTAQYEWCRAVVCRAVHSAQGTMCRSVPLTQCSAVQCAALQEKAHCGRVVRAKVWQKGWHDVLSQSAKFQYSVGVKQRMSVKPVDTMGSMPQLSSRTNTSLASSHMTSISKSPGNGPHLGCMATGQPTWNHLSLPCRRGWGPGISASRPVSMSATALHFPRTNLFQLQGSGAG